MLDSKVGKVALATTQDDQFWFIETTDPIVSNNTQNIFKWTISKRDTSLLQTTRIVLGENSSNTYIYDFTTNDKESYLFKASHRQLLRKGKNNYSGGLEIYVFPTTENFSSMSSIEGKDYDFSKIKKMSKVSSETLDEFKVRLDIPTMKFD